MKYIIGIDIGGTVIKYALFTTDGMVCSNSSIPTKKVATEIVDDLVKVIKEYQKENDVLGVGISVPGTIDEHGTIIFGGAIRDFYNFPLRKILEEKTSLPCVIENDANCFALAEKWLGNATDLTDYLCVTFGTGVGGALVLNNGLYRGAYQSAGEIGLMLIKTCNEEQDPINSSFNFYGSVPYGLMRLYSVYANKTAENGIEVYNLKDSQDEAAIKAVKEYVDSIAVGLLNISVILNPQAILIGGSISNNPSFIKDLQDAFLHLWKRHSHVSFRTPTQIIPCGLTSLSGSYGAAYKLKCSLLE